MAKTVLRIRAAAAALLCVFLFSSCGKTSYLEGREKDTFSSTPSGEETFPEPALEEAEQEAEISSASAEETGADSVLFYVEAAGALVSPGVYQVPSGSRVFEVIALAGGLTDDADTSDINQAAPVSDGQKIYIRRQGEEAPAAAAAAASSAGQDPAADGRININTADASALMTLPGIGQAKADAILSYREKQGPFKKTEDLKKISGIKDGLYSKIADRITV